MTKIEEQILENQIVIMGMLQDLQDELEPIQCIQETHDLIISERKNKGEYRILEAFERVVAEILDKTDSEYTIADFNVDIFREKFINMSGLADLVNPIN